ncbi:DegT/DnrJ/EryC1/StrS family aminotransferase [Candidatus Marinimicrobia bacterium MT.SAG.3]|nr:DegT/DnrJ/EryC1/StrS family aminotransferase [Candidatus Marinimicrobia bacterium MT.SAG.3]
MEMKHNHSKIAEKHDDLALLGGNPVRTKDFRSEPMIDDQEISLVAELMRKNRFSKFVGSPMESTREDLKKKSVDLLSEEDGFSFLGGEYVRKFEAEWSRLIGADYAVSVNSATSGLTTALRALDLEPGSEVITTPFTFTATAASIVLANCVPVFCDIDPETFCLSPAALEKLINRNTCCVMPVHWCGNAGDLDEILAICNKHGLKVVEDAAQSPLTYYNGKSLGTFGDVGVFSFNEPKNIMTGEGGIIVTDDQRIAEKCRLIRNHGEAIITDEDSDDYLINTVGYNFRLTEIHAAIAYMQLKKSKKLNSIRANNYKHLKKNVEEKLGEYLTPQRITHPESYFAYTAAFRWDSAKSGVHRDIIAQAMISEGIPLFKGYHRLVCDHPMFKRKLAFGVNHHPWHEGYYSGNVDYNALPLPNARHLVDNDFIGFLLMGWPNTTDDIDHIILAFEKVIHNLERLRDLTLKGDIKFSLGR